MEFYRYESYQQGGVDEDSYFPPTVRVSLSTLNLVKETPKGYWICFGDPKQYYGDKRWVSKTSRKRYAYPTKEEALNGFIFRKKRQVRILKAILDIAQTSLELGLELQKKEEI